MAGEVESGYSIAGEPFINFQAGFSKPFHVAIQINPSASCNTLCTMFCDKPSREE